VLGLAAALFFVIGAASARACINVNIGPTSVTAADGGPAGSLGPGDVIGFSISGVEQEAAWEAGIVGYGTPVKGTGDGRTIEGKVVVPAGASFDGPVKLVVSVEHSDIDNGTLSVASKVTIDPATSTFDYAGGSSSPSPSPPPPTPAPATAPASSAPATGGGGPAGPPTDPPRHPSPRAPAGRAPAATPPASSAGYHHSQPTVRARVSASASASPLASTRPIARSAATRPRIASAPAPKPAPEQRSPRRTRTIEKPLPHPKLLPASGRVADARRTHARLWLLAPALLLLAGGLFAGGMLVKRHRRSIPGPAAQELELEAELQEMVAEARAQRELPARSRRT
jgi:hypothetical protein